MDENCILVYRYIPQQHANAGVTLYIVHTCTKQYITVHVLVKMSNTIPVTRRSYPVGPTWQPLCPGCAPSLQRQWHSLRLRSACKTTMTAHDATRKAAVHLKTRIAKTTRDHVMGHATRTVEQTKV